MISSSLFKSESPLVHGWLNYGLVLSLLLIILFILGRKQRLRSPKESQCKVIEKRFLGQKTVMYIVEYQKQQFFLADNQSALAIYPINAQVKAELDV